MEKASTMRDLVCAVGGPMMPGENRKSWLARVARSADISPRVAAAAYYGEIQNEALKQKLKKAVGVYEADNLARQMEHFADSLLVRDEDFFRPYADAWRHFARQARALPRPDGSEDSAE